MTITPGALAHVNVIPGIASVPAGGMMTFSAQATDRFGNVIPDALPPGRQ